jgi:hypothetical protein
MENEKKWRECGRFEALDISELEPEERARFVETLKRADEYSNGDSIWELLAVELLETDWRFGRLSLNFPMGEKELSRPLAHLAERYREGWTQRATVDVVYHPDRGLVVVRGWTPEDPNQVVVDQLVEPIATLKRLQGGMKSVVAERFEACSPEDVPVAAALGLPTVRAGCLYPDDEVETDYLIRRPSLPWLAERLEEMRAEQLEPAQVEWSGRVVEALEAGELGRFDDHDHCVSLFASVGHDLAVIRGS